MKEDILGSPSGYRIQKTLSERLEFSGVGLHTGKLCRVVIHPAPANHGLVFFRADLENSPPILAHYNAVVATAMATTLGVPSQPEYRISTVEHILAALFAMGISNARVDVHGPEIPILDGSATEFFEAFLDDGLELQPFTTPTLRVMKAIRVYQNGAVCELHPRDRLRLTTSVEFSHPLIGLQTFALELTPRAFQEQIASARTFGFTRDLEKHRSLQLAQGASLDNVLAFSETGVVNAEGTRFDDECVRHKLLDALGDLALCGSWIEAEMVSLRGGHGMHLNLLQGRCANTRQTGNSPPPNSSMRRAGRSPISTQNSPSFRVFDTLPVFPPTPLFPTRAPQSDPRSQRRLPGDALP